jgi:hypothetical protein
MENPIIPQTIYTFVGDTAPSVNFNVTRQNPTPGLAPVVVDLTGCSVSFFIQNPLTLVRTNSGNATCTITSPTAGAVTYAWGSSDIPVEGIYNAQLKITYSNGKLETAPVSIEVGSSV